jgi:hypothetical protein
LESGRIFFDDYDIISFSGQTEFENNLSSDYLVLLDEIHYRKDLCIFTDNVYDLKLVSLSYKEMLEMFFNNIPKFGVLNDRNHFYPINLPNDITTFNNIIQEISNYKKIINYKKRINYKRD